MPSEKPLCRQRSRVVARRVQHHFNDALYVSIHGLEAANIHPKTARNRGADLLRVQLFPFDFAALEYIRAERLEDRLLTHTEAETLHASHEATLLMAHSGKPLFGKRIDARPVGGGVACPQVQPVLLHLFRGTLLSLG